MMIKKLKISIMNYNATITVDAPSQPKAVTVSK